MVTILDRLFVNLFDDPRISPSRFLDFSMYLYDQMMANNADGKYDKELINVQSVIDSVDKEINQVDAGLNTQVTNTSGVNGFIKDFGQFMKTNNGAIAYALGGINRAAFRDFYPHKNEEYLSANRKTMPRLAARVGGLATMYTKILGEKLTSDLQAFLPGYKKVLTAQRMQIGNVNKGRAERNSAFTDGQWTLTAVVHSVAGINNRKPEEAQKLFDFTMLYSLSKPSIIKENGKLAAKESSTLLNRTLNKRVKIWVANTSLNADALVWLAMSPTDEAPATAIVIKANSKEEIKAENLESLKGTFVMIKNASDINEVVYAVEITGLKKTKEEKAAEAETLQVIKEEKIA